MVRRLRKSLTSHPKRAPKLVKMSKDDFGWFGFPYLMHRVELLVCILWCHQSSSLRCSHLFSWFEFLQGQRPDFIGQFLIPLFWVVLSKLQKNWARTYQSSSTVTVVFGSKPVCEPLEITGSNTAMPSLQIKRNKLLTFS